MNGNLVERLAAGLAAKNSDRLPAATVASYEDLGDGVALVVVTHSSNAGRAANYQALANTLGDKARPIEGSFRRINDAHETRQVSVGYVVAAEVIMELDAKTEARMQVVAKNVLMDDGDKTLWNITESDGQRYVTRQGTENIKDVLSTIASTRVDLMDATDVGFASVQAQDYIAYVDTATASVKYGYVVASNGDESQVLPRDGDTLTSVSASMIVEMRGQVDTSDNLLKRSLSKVEAKLADPDKLKEYYRKVYSYDPAYLTKIEQMIDKSASL